MGGPRRAAWAIVTVSVALGAVAVALRSTDDAFLLGGIQVNEADHERWFDALERAGMNAVATTVYAKQGDWDSDHLWWEDEEEGVVLEIRGAVDRGLEVVLIPRVALDHAFPRNRFLWHGLILPRDETLLESWFDQYGRFLVRWAEVAEHEGVAVFAVGSEMNALASTVPLEALPALEGYYLDPDKQAERRELYEDRGASTSAGDLVPRGGGRFDSLDAYLEAESLALAEWAAAAAYGLEDDALGRINRRRALLDRLWRETIARVRRVYHGRLTYAANFDQYKEVGFWPELDLIGINAYFPLRELDDPAGDENELLAALEGGWRNIFAEIEAFRVSAGVPTTPVLFTEIGYARRAGVTLAPWAGSGMTLVETGDDKRLVVWERQAEDLRERALAIRALRRVHRETGADLLDGLLYWKLSTEPAHLEIEPFVLVLGSGEDPLAAELRRFRDGRNENP